MRYYPSATSGNRGELLEELRMLDDTLSEANSLNDLKYFGEKRSRVLDDYVDALYSSYDHLSLPERELQILGELADKGNTLKHRIEWREKRAQPKESLLSKYKGKAMKAAAVLALAFSNIAPGLYNDNVKAGVAAERTRVEIENAVTLPALYSAAGPSHAAVDSMLSRGFWDIYPVAGVEQRVSSFYGERALADSIDGNTYHRGVDLHAPAGTPIIAPADGVVSKRNRLSLHVDAGNYSYKAIHMWPKKGLVEGATVEAGDTLGFIASKKYLPRGVNPHLHLEVSGESGLFSYAAGKNIDPLIMFNDSIAQEVVRNTMAHNTPSGVRYMKGATIEEKLLNKERAQIESLAYPRLAPIYVTVKKNSKA